MSEKKKTRRPTRTILKMKSGDKTLYSQIERVLFLYNRNIRPLPGINKSSTCRAFIKELIKSIHRIRYVYLICKRRISEVQADPRNELFDPLKATIWYQRQGQIDEAFWLIFLSVHFGKHNKVGWQHVREIYGCLGGSGCWDWETTSKDLYSFRRWLNDHQKELRRERGFGKHRKYISLDAYKPNATGDAVETYINWVKSFGTHQELMEQVTCYDRYKAFDELFKSMKCVASFGRTGRFDYLAMVGNLGLAPIEPGSAYLQSSTGPLRGARLLFGSEKDMKFSIKNIEVWLKEIDSQLKVGMQVFEDALCNWQKNLKREVLHS